MPNQMNFWESIIPLGDIIPYKLHMCVYIICVLSKLLKKYFPCLFQISLEFFLILSLYYPLFSFPIRFLSQFSLSSYFCLYDYVKINT